MAKVNMKNALAQHVEKIVFGIAVLIVLGSLAMTNWIPYSGTPGEITEKVKGSRARLLSNTWPTSEREQYILTQDDSPKNLVHERLYSKLDPTPFEMSTKMVFDVFGGNEPVREPVLLAVDDPRVIAGRAYLHQLDPIDENAPSIEEMLAAEADPEADVIDELKTRTEQRPGMDLEGMDEMDASSLASRDIRSMASELSNRSTSINMTQLMQYRDRLGSGADLSELGLEGLLEGEGEGALPPPMNGKGYHVASVRGVFPLRDQIKAFAEAINQSYHEAASVFDIRDFELERQVMQPGPDPWSGEWTRVNLDIADEVLTNSTGFDADVVNSIITNAVITMPLPMRISGRWVDMATHPRIKKFELSEDQMALEVEMQRKLLEEAAEEQKLLDESSIKRGGFYKHTFDNRELQSTVMGGGYSAFNIGTGYNMMALGGGGGYSEDDEMSGGFGGGRRNPATRGAVRGPRGQLIDPMADIVQKMTKGIKNDKEKKEMEEKIRKWVGDRMSADGELLLFRYLDFSVEPGQTYRYRIRLILKNPNFGRRIADAGGLDYVVQGETRETPWSEPTAPVTVPADVQYFLTDIRDLASRVLPNAGFDVYQWDTQHGTSMNSRLEIRFGQMIGDAVKTTVIDPAESKYEEEEYRFVTNDFLVDLLEDIQLERDFHEKIDDGTAVKMAQGSQGRMQLAGRALIRTEESLKQFSPALNRKSHDYQKKYQEQQAKTYAYLKPSVTDELAGLEGLGEGEVSLDMLEDFGGSRRLRNQLKKARRRGGGDAE